MKKLSAIVAALMCAFAAWAADDSSSAILQLLNTRGSSSPKAFEAALKQVKIDAEKGRPLQQFIYALVMPNDPKAKEYLERSRAKIRMLAEQKNSALAWYLLSLESQDVGYLKRAAEGGNVQALNAWGTLQHNAILDDESVPAAKREEILREVFDSFHKAAELKDPNGIYNLGMCYMNGIGCEQDPEMAIQCFKTAAEAGHPDAINNIGGCCREGVIVEQDPVRAARWFKLSADMGNIYGQINYGLALQNGEGVEKDETAAVAYFAEAIKQGSPEAVNLMAMCYLRGRGVPKDDKKAVEMLRKSAEMGFPPAMDNLSECYKVGVGVEKNSMESMVWMLRAKAARGDRAAAKWLETNGYRP